jgi:hypothetical protein
MQLGKTLIGGQGRSRSGREIPSHLTTLSIGWLNNRLKAIAVHRGVIEGTWEAADEVRSPGNFGELIKEAAEKTGYRGQTVSLILGHPRLAQQLVDLPPVKRGAMRKILQRQAQQQRIFAGEAAWACQSCLPSKMIQQAVLHLFPKAMLDQLVAGCHANGLRLTLVTPASSVLHQQLVRLPLEKGEVGLLAAKTGATTTLVIGRNDGQILLARTLPATWNDGADRLAVDLNRTILFVNQQYGLSVKGLWLFGEDAQEQCRDIQRLMQVPVQLSPVECGPLYWETQALRLRPGHSPNFISAEMRIEPQKRAVARIVGAATALFVAASAGVSVYCHRQSEQETRNIEILQRQAMQYVDRLQKLTYRNAELDRKEKVIGVVTGGRTAPVVEWVLGYLSEACPDDLVITNLHLKEDLDSWKLQLAGTRQGSEDEGATRSFSNSVVVLATRLSTGPLHMAIDGSLKEVSAGGSKQTIPPISSWPTRTARTNTPTGVKLLAENQFLIEGVVR